MSDDLVNVYDAASLQEAQMLSDRLQAAGIKTFIDNTDSPLDGLTAGDQTISIRVLPNDVDRAAVFVQEFEAEDSADFALDGDEDETSSE